MRVIGIDPATVTGAAWTDGRTVAHQTWMLTKGNHGAAINDLARNVREIIAERGCDLLACEDASFGSHNQRVKSFHNALRGALEAIAAELGIPLWKYNPSSLKSQTCGNGRASKGQMIAAVRTLYGIDSPNDNVADAVAIAMLAVRGIKPVGMVKREVRKRIKKLAKLQARMF